MASVVDPIYGFVEVMLNESNFEYQKPYDTPLFQRYIYQNGIHRFWVYADDKPFRLGSNTQPRTEIRILVISTTPLFLDSVPFFFFLMKYPKGILKKIFSLIWFNIKT